MMIEIVATVAGLLGISAIQLLKQYRSFKKRLDEKDAESELLEHATGYRRILADRLLTQAIDRLYPLASLSAQGLGRIAIVGGDDVRLTTLVARPEWHDIRLLVTPDTVHTKFVTATPLAQPFDLNLIPERLATLERRKLKLWNAPIYRLERIAVADGVLSLDFSRDDFLRYRYTICYLLDQLVDVLLNTNYDVGQIVGALSTRGRSHYLPNAAALVDFKNHICAGGVGVTVAFARKSERDFVIPLQRRAGNVADGQDLFSIIPKAFHQPTVDPVAEVGLDATVFREFYEELLGGEEAEDPRTSRHRRIAHDWYRRVAEPVSWFEKHTGAYDLHVVYCGINALHGNYEFGLLLVVHDEYYWRKFRHELRTNWEASDSTEPLVSTKDTAGLADLVGRPNWADESLVAFVRSLQVWKETVPGRCAAFPFSTTLRQ